MSIFSAIRDKIFGRRAEPAPQPTPSAAPAAAPAGGGAWTGVATGQILTGAVAAAQPVDVEAVLVEIAAEKGNPDLNWRSSIVDLMKLLDLDSSLDNRKELATELGYTGAKDGSAEMNVWLHRKVLDQLEANGGHVPASLKD